MNKPTLLFRIQNYNKVSLGALLGATPDRIIQQFNLVFWTSTEPFPADRLTERTLYIHSFMLLHTQGIREEISRIREAHSTMDFLAGGAQATAAPDSTLDLGFDFVFCGDGEIDFAGLLNSWLNGKLARGIHEQSDTPINLDLFPGFSPLIDYIPPIEITRGCIFGCMYCVVPKLCKGRMMHRSIDSIVKILEAYYKIKTRRKRIKFLSPNAFAYGSDGRSPNVPALKSLLATIKDFGVAEILFGSFPGEVRPDFVTREVMETIAPYAVNRTILMGVQTGSNEMLKKMNRGHTLEQAINAISLIREFNYQPHIDFIIGNPGETPQERIELLDFMEEMVKQYKIKVHMHAFMSIPGTAWQHFAQTPIEPEIHQRLKKLEKGGHLDGWWENQIGLGRIVRKVPARKIS